MDPLGVSPTVRHLSGRLRPSVLAFPARPYEGLFCSSLGILFTSNMFPMPGHAFNHHQYPFPFTLDRYWAIIRLLTLSGASPVVVKPRFCLLSHNPLRDGFCSCLRDCFTSTNLPVPICAFKHYPHCLSFAFNAHWTLLGALQLSHTSLLGPNPVS